MSTLSNDAVHAYRQTARTTDSVRGLEIRIFDQITADLARAAGDAAPVAEVATALHRNRRLWDMLAADLVQPQNGYPDALKAQLLGLAGFVRRHSGRVLAREAEIEPLIELNRTVLDGLRRQAKEGGVHGRA